MSYSNDYDDRRRNNNNDSKRARDRDEQLQNLQLQQRSSAVRALERLHKTERLKPIDRLVILFNMHFQRRDTPSFRVVCDSPLRILHPQYFEFVSPAEWVNRFVREEDCDELLSELDEIIMTHRAVLGSGMGPSASDSSKGSNNNKPPHVVNKPLAAGNADGTIGWGDEEDEDDQNDPNSFSALLGDEADQTVYAANDEERADIGLDAFWGLLADCVEATQRYREVKGALLEVGNSSAATGVPNGAAGKTPSNYQQALASNPLLVYGGDLFSSLQKTNSTTSANKSGSANQQRDYPAINMSVLDGNTAAAAAAKDATNTTAAAAGSLAPFYGYHTILREADSVLTAIPREELAAAQPYLAAMAAVPANTNTSTSAFFGPQAHFIYKLAYGDCNKRLSAFYLDAFVKLYRQGRVEEEGSAAGASATPKYALPPIPHYAFAEAEQIREKRLALLNQRGGNTSDTNQQFIRNGFGVEYIPSEEDLMRAMAMDDGAGMAGREGADGEAGGEALTHPSSANTGALDEGEALFKEEIHNYHVAKLQQQMNLQQQMSQLLTTPDGKARFIKPVRYCKVKTGYVWNAYNRAKYSLKSNEKPPQVVQWYEFILFYPLAVSSVKPTDQLYRVEYTEKGPKDDFVILVFSVGAPYADVAYKIVNEKWDRRPGGVRCTFDDKGKLRLYFRLASTNYRR